MDELQDVARKVAMIDAMTDEIRRAAVPEMTADSLMALGERLTRRAWTYLEDHFDVGEDDRLVIEVAISLAVGAGWRATMLDRYQQPVPWTTSQPGIDP